MDHELKEGRFFPQPFLGSPVRKVVYFPSPTPCPNSMLLIEIAQSNDSSAENPAGHGFASTRPKRKNRFNQPGRGRSRTQTGLSARDICRQKRRLPAPSLAGQELFDAEQLEPRSSMSSTRGKKAVCNDACGRGFIDGLKGSKSCAHTLGSF